MNADALRALRANPILPQWDGEVDADALAGTRAILTKALDKLLAAKKPPTPAGAKKVFAKAIQELNDLDNDVVRFIMTIEREDLCEWLYEAGELCGISPDEEWVDEFRDW